MPGVVMISVGQVGCTPLIYCVLVVSKEGMENKIWKLVKTNACKGVVG